MVRHRQRGSVRVREEGALYAPAGSFWGGALTAKRTPDSPRMTAPRRERASLAVARWAWFTRRTGRIVSSPALHIVFCVVFTADALAQGSIASDRAALEALYDATGGASWADSTNWKTAAPLDTWYGVATDADGRVTRLELGENGLTGSLPPALGDLANLERLSLWTNVLTGPIPPELGRLANLRELALLHNALSGPIPSELGGLANLQQLALLHNALSGPIPPELGRLTNLQGLNLAENDLSGPIPPELGGLANLRELWLQGNALSGPIPSELGGLTNLQELILSENNLSGPIPPQLGQLANLQALYLHDNASLAGPLPLELTRLSQLMLLSISRTALCAPHDAGFQAWLATIEFLGATCNRAPEPVGTIPPQTLTAGGTAREVSIAGYFLDPDGDPLAYSAASDDEDTVTAHAVGEVVWLLPETAGTATVTVTASDPSGLSAAQPMAVTVVVSPGPQSERGILEALYDATAGPSWTKSTNWKTNAPLGQWHGVGVDAEGRVTALHLWGNGLSGLIPSALGRLANLQEFSLGENELNGPIPPGCGSWRTG